ncbi:hypothetical protein ANCDUO_05165 [Ancylostoma duodenale]|uniref:Uncharacterized protein n=1 Tax=Ancylostoma duodenale TaxID=51022 RepID=A0A0C2D4S9_9BILA|nr:hypothetical protein ANCDUO_05165 [Ancylostoma duodenale]
MASRSASTLQKSSTSNNVNDREVSADLMSDEMATALDQLLGDKKTPVFLKTLISHLIDAQLKLITILVQNQELHFQVDKQREENSSSTRADAESKIFPSAMAPTEQAQIRALHFAGVSNRTIAKQFGRSRRCDEVFVKNPDDYGQKNPRGHSQKLTRVDECHIGRLASNSTSSANQIRTELPQGISKSTIIRAIHCRNLMWQKMKHAPRFNEQHRLVRLDFARNNMGTNWAQKTHDEVVEKDHKHADFASAKECQNQIDWYGSLSHVQTVDEKYETFLSILKHCIELFVPS